MRLLVIAPPAFEPLELLRRERPDIALLVDAEEAESADAVLVAPQTGGVLAELWPRLRNVRWIHTLAAGVEFLPFELLRESDVVVTNSRGLYADALAEFAIMAMLWFARDGRRLMRNKEEHRWERYRVEPLHGRVVGIIGYGGIGRAVGRRVEGLDMRVLPVRRRREVDDATMDEVLAQADYVVMSTPLTPSTAGLMSRERISKLKRTAVFINLGRGGTVDEEALIDALRDRRIRGAALDVFETEPLPAEHPFWDLDNVIVSPHNADYTADSHLRAMRFYIENLNRYRKGEPLLNIVDKTEQY